MSDIRKNPLSFRTIVVLAYLMLHGNDMLDLIFLISTIAFFALSLAYVRGCQRL